MSKSKLAGIIIACSVVTILVVVLFSTKPWQRTPTADHQTLSTSVSPSGAGSVSPSGGQYASGAQVTLTASAASGYTFDHWSGSASGTTSTITIIMDSGKDITAHFKLEPTLEPIDMSPEELVETIYGNDLTSLQREELWKGYVGKRVRWTSTLTDVWSTDDYPGFGMSMSGVAWARSLKEPIIAAFESGYVYDTTPYGSTRTHVYIHVAFNDESKPSLLSLPRGSVVTYEGTISYEIYMSGGPSLAASLGAGIRLVDGTIVGHT